MVFRVRARIAHMGEGEEDELLGIGGVGQDFLIPGHGGVEAQLPDRRADSPAPEAGKHRPVFQDNRPAGRNFALIWCRHGHIERSSKRAVRVLGNKQTAVTYKALRIRVNWKEPRRDTNCIPTEPCNTKRPNDRHS